MSSYQKLKAKCEYLQGQVNIFKNALTIYAPIKYIENEDGTIFLGERIYIERNKIYDEQIKLELCRWVASNLDKDSVLRLLKMKEELEK